MALLFPGVFVTHCTHSGLRILHAPALSSSGDELLCSVLLCWDLFPAGKFCRSPSERCCLLPWLGTHLGADSLLFLPGRRRRLGRVRCSAKLWWLFPCGIFFKQQGFCLLGLQGELGQSQERKRRDSGWRCHCKVHFGFAQIQVNLGFFPSKQLVLQEPDP